MHPGEERRQEVAAPAHLFAEGPADDQDEEREHGQRFIVDVDMLLGDVAMVEFYRDLGVRQAHLIYNRNNSVGNLSGKTGHLTKILDNLNHDKDLALRRQWPNVGPLIIILLTDTPVARGGCGPAS